MSNNKNPYLAHLDGYMLHKKTNTKRKNVHGKSVKKPSIVMETPPDHTASTHSSPDIEIDKDLSPLKSIELVLLNDSQQKYQLVLNFTMKYQLFDYFGNLYTKLKIRPYCDIKFIFELTEAKVKEKNIHNIYLTLIQFMEIL